jgi:hypothetical protein
MKQGTSRFYSIVLIVLFVLLLCTPFSIHLLGLYKAGEISKAENRNLAKKPVFDFAKLDPYPKDFEKWYNDHFIYREDFLYTHNYISFLMGQSPMPKNVMLGVDKWLFYNEKESDLYEGKFDIPNDSIQMIVKELQYRTEVLERKHIKFYVLIAPLKAEIYPEYLPPYIQRAKTKTVTDRIVEAIQSHPKINLITCKNQLLEKKRSNQVYFKNDNHWNDQGAFVGYQLLLKRISKDFPSVNFPGKYKWISQVKQGGNLANMIGLDNILSEKTNKIVVENAKAKDAPKGNYPCIEGFAYPGEYEMDWQVPDSTLPKAVVIRDSFFGALLPLFSENFRRSVYIFDSWQYRFNLDIIEAEKPDVVVLEIFEPHISNMLNNLSYLDKSVKH